MLLAEAVPASKKRIRPLMSRSKVRQRMTLLMKTVSKISKVKA